MKISLVVKTPGPTQGKAIPIPLSQFLIGRDAHCHLRPASPVISNRHCAILLRGEKVFVRDFESTNGTFVNGRQIKGETEVKNADSLRIGPLEFGVRIEAAARIKTPAPAAPTDDEAAAALLLSLQEEGGPPPGSHGVDSEGVPTGSTVMEMPAPPLPPPESSDQETPPSANKKPEKKPNPADGDTSSAANTLLQKYLRRGRPK